MSYENVINLPPYPGSVDGYTLYWCGSHRCHHTSTTYTENTIKSPMTLPINLAYIGERKLQWSIIYSETKLGSELL